MAGIELEGRGEFSDDEFQEALKRLEKIITDVKARANEAIEIFGRMSRDQMKRAKAKFKGIWSGDQIQRMFLAGRGIIAPWLAMKPKSLTARELRDLPDEARRVLSNPENEIEFLTPNKGVQFRRVADLTPVELRQVTDKKKGMLKAEEQAKRMLTFNRSRSKKTPEPADVEDSNKVLVSSDRKYLTVVGSHISLRVPIKTVRGILA